MAKLRRLLSSGYLPIELPPPFSSTSLGDTFPSPRVLYISDLWGSFNKENFVSKPATHSLARVGSLRRKLSILNPVSFLILASSISTNWHICRSIITPREGVLSTPQWTVSGKRALRWRTPFQDLPQELIRTRAGRRFVLQTDIGRFYPSIYTHSLSWAVHGKEISKEKGFGKKYEYFGNALDLYSRNAQDRQTIGIPVGPDTSLVLAELIMSRLDRHLASLGHSASIVRYVDDIEISFSTRTEAEEALVQIDEYLSSFELTLNPLKTNIIELPDPVAQPWVTRLRKLQIRSNHGQATDLIDYFSEAFAESKKSKTGSVLAYALSRIDKEKILPNSQAWPVLEGLIYQAIAVEAGCIRNATILLCKLAISGYPINIALLSRTISGVISQAITHSYGSEIAWALWLAICFHVQIDESIAAKLSKTQDPIIALTALHAKSLDLIPHLDIEPWRELLVKESLTNENWLLAYESNIKGWLSSKTGGDFVGVNTVFKHLKSNRVHFYDETAYLSFRNALERQTPPEALPQLNENLFDDIDWLNFVDSEYFPLRQPLFRNTS